MLIHGRGDSCGVRFLVREVHSVTESQRRLSPSGSPPFDPAVVIRSRAYLTALLLAAILGIPISAVSYGFLALVAAIQEFVFVDLPRNVFDGSVPVWWPVPWLLMCGLLTAATIRYLPGNGGHSPALGFSRRSASARCWGLKLP